MFIGFISLWAGVFWVPLLVAAVLPGTSKHETLIAISSAVMAVVWFLIWQDQERSADWERGHGDTAWFQLLAAVAATSAILGLLLRMYRIQLQSRSG